MRGNIDIVELLNPAGLSVVITRIEQQAEVERAAQKLTQRHGQTYTAKVVNVPLNRYPHMAHGHRVDLSRYV